MPSFRTFGASHVFWCAGLAFLPAFRLLSIGRRRCPPLADDGLRRSERHPQLTYVETRMSVWEALAGRAPGEPTGPADPGLWGAVVDRLKPARATPVPAAGVEPVDVTSARASTSVMLLRPDDSVRPFYLRLTPQEYQLALIMDGSHTVAR